tara:strand:- start:221 stop:358 length:138 start_codon:yes stop_codon:yes gene_type:complete
MDNITLTLGFFDVEKLGIKLLFMLIDESDMGKKVGMNVDAILILN